MREKARGELVYKPLLDFREEKWEFVPHYYRHQLTEYDKSVTILLRQAPITSDTRNTNIPPVNVILVDDQGNHHVLAENLQNIIAVLPCSVFPDWDYEVYLQSKEWESRKKEYYSRHGCKCDICGSGSHIQLHHLNYKRLGYENDSDLIGLCTECHMLLHAYKDQYLSRIGDLARMWYYPTRCINNANTCGDLIRRFIAKYKPQLDYVFSNLPPIRGAVKAKFVSQLVSSMKSKDESKVLPYHMIIKLVNSK